MRPVEAFSPCTQSIYLADMCGDGLPDLVRIRNGEVCYGPNLGYGRFGAKVTMNCKLTPSVGHRYSPVGNEVYAHPRGRNLSVVGGGMIGRATSAS